MPSGVVVSYPLHPGNAVLPSDVQIQAQEISASCTGVVYFAETPSQFLSRFGKVDDPAQGPELGRTIVEVTAQTSSNEAIVLTGMRLAILQRKAPPTTGIAVDVGGCGASLSGRPFWTSLDKPGLPIIAETEPAGIGSPAQPPVSFPYKILPSDPEDFLLTVQDTMSYSTFGVEIDWVVAGKAGRTVLYDSGNQSRPFQVYGAPKVPPYILGNDEKLQLSSYRSLFPWAYGL